ncbi:MAG: beta-galactosidase, partial [Anaerolineae bacterium]
MGLGLAAALALGAWAVSDRADPADGTAILYIPSAADKSLGVNVRLEQMDASARDQALTAMEAAGLRWLRLRFPWNAIEPEPGRYRWELWDDILDDVVQHDLSVVAVLDGAPAWAQPPEDVGNALAPPRKVRDFGDWAAILAARYGDRIDYYQIWDEPNIAPHWGAREIDPAAYARLLREGAIRIHASDPQAIILTAALAPTVEPGGANMSELLFLEGLYRNAAAQWFDVVAAQPYPFAEPVNAPPERGRLNWRRVALLREVMERHGDQETAVWAVSWGSPHDLRDALDLARRDWPWLGPMLWAAWSPGDTHAEYALVDGAGQPNAPFYNLQQAALQPVIAWPGSYPPDHPSGHYQGDWRVTSLGADLANSGDRLTIPFQGTRFDLAVRRGDYRAFLFVTVDGQPANALPRDTEGRAYIVLYDPLGELDRVTLARGLEGGAHTVEIVADRGWGQWAIAGWAVAWGGGNGVPWLSFVMGLASIVMLGLTLGYAWRHRVALFASRHQLVAAGAALDDRLFLLVTASVVLLLYVVVGTIPSLLVLGILTILLLLRPWNGLLLVALSLPFYQVGKPLLGKVFSIVEILLLLTAAAWLFNRLLALVGTGDDRPAGKKWLRGSPWKIDLLDGCVIALLLVSAVSLLWAEHTR